MNSLVLVTVLTSAFLNGGFSAKIPAANSDVGLNTVQMIENHGYVCESHQITTEDGYILTYHRIPKGINDDGSTTKPPVLLMHGLLSSSADYVNMEPEHSLGFILADLGYDVWMGNARGNAWSRNHTTLDVVADAEEFFDFSWHEIGHYDLAAGIDHILSVNGDDSLYYVGHSQGTTSFMTLASTRPEYNDKIKIASLMGPASYMEHQTNTLLTVLSKYITDIEKLLKKYGIYELPGTEFIRAAASSFCSQPDNVYICANAIGLIDGLDAPEFQIDKLPVILSNAPSNAASQQFLHYGQLIKNGGFTQYNYGADKNQEIYGSETPPAYDLSKISAPVAVYYGKNDGLVNYMDAETVVKNLGNVVNDDLLSYELFNHIDFIWAKDVVDLLYNELIETMEQY